MCSSDLLARLGVQFGNMPLELCGLLIPAVGVKLLQLFQHVLAAQVPAWTISARTRPLDATIRARLGRRRRRTLAGIGILRVRWDMLEQQERDTGDDGNAAKPGRG